MPLTALALVGTLKASPEPSSSELLAHPLLDALAQHDVTGELVRLDAELSETTSEGAPTLFGKVAVVGVVGNEDGAHRVTAEVLQALNDVGFSIPAQAGTYWVGEAMGSVDFKDLPATPDAVAGATATAARNAAHLARLLAKDPYSASGQD